MNAKYIVIEAVGQELLFTFPETVMHLHMLEAIKSIRQGVPGHATRPYRGAALVSAGRVTAMGHCYGKSETLNVESRPVKDTLLLGMGQQS